MFKPSESRVRFTYIRTTLGQVIVHCRFVRDHEADLRVMVHLYSAGSRIRTDVLLIPNQAD